MKQWSATTGRNLIGRFTAISKRNEPAVDYRAKANGVDRRGDQRWNDMQLVAVHPEMSNETFTTVTVRFERGAEIVTRIFHNTRYLTEA